MRDRYHCWIEASRFDARTSPLMTRLGSPGLGRYLTSWPIWASSGSHACEASGLGDKRGVHPPPWYAQDMHLSFAGRIVARLGCSEGVTS